VNTRGRKIRKLKQTSAIFTPSHPCEKGTSLDCGLLFSYLQPGGKKKVFLSLLKV
jgi:hypothetical protein